MFKLDLRPMMRATSLAATVAGVLALTSGEALGAPLACGDRITTDTTLERNLVNCPNKGIVIGASKVKLDLNGHTIDGDNESVEQCPRKESCDVGILVEGRDDVTVKGGTIKGFVDGIDVFDARDVRLRRLTVSLNTFGVVVFGTRDAHLGRLTVSHNNGIGVVFVDAARSGMGRTSVIANGIDLDQPGMGVIKSHHVEIRRSSILRSGDIGLFSDKADALVVKKSRMARNSELGMLLAGDDNEIVANRLVRNGEGIAMKGNDNVIKRNHIFRVRVFGIILDGGNRNLVAHNEVRRAHKVGIIVGFSRAGRGHDTEVIGNRVRGAGDDGVRVGRTKFTDTLLEDNHVSGSDDDGIDVRRASTTLTGNQATSNGDLGIDAVNGVIDGGGNRASGNGDARQCVKLACG